MRRSIIFTVLITFLLLLTSCTIKKENNLEDAKAIAKDQFGISSILISSLGTSGSEIKSHTTRQYPIYILGLNEDGEEVFIIVPSLKSQKSYTVDWPFIKSFADIAEQLNSSAKEVVLSTDKYDQIELIDSKQGMETYNNEIEINNLDFTLMINYDKYSIVQISNEIVIYKE